MSILPPSQKMPKIEVFSVSILAFLDENFLTIFQQFKFLGEGSKDNCPLAFFRLPSPATVRHLACRFSEGRRIEHAEVGAGAVSDILNPVGLQRMTCVRTPYVSLLVATQDDITAVSLFWFSFRLACYLLVC